MSAWLHWTPLSPKSSILTFLHCPLWSSVSELSEVLFPRLRTSFCPRKKLSGKSYVAHVHAQYGTLCNRLEIFYHMFSSIQSLSHVQLFVTPWTAACQASLSIINSVRNQCYLSSIVGGKKNRIKMNTHEFNLLPQRSQRNQRTYSFETYIFTWPTPWFSGSKLTSDRYFFIFNILMWFCHSFHLLLNHFFRS